MNSSASDSSPDAIGSWLRRLALVASIVLLALCSWFVWRISMVSYQMESAIVAISADVKQMSSTGAQISDHLQKLDIRLQAIEKKAANAMNLDEIEHILDEINQARDAAPISASRISPYAEREIEHLLRQIRRSDHRFTYSDEDKSGTRYVLIKRLVRKTICFSKSIQMHDIVIGLFVNRYEFGLLL
jgi:hypothetical protein